MKLITSLLLTVLLLSCNSEKTQKNDSSTKDSNIVELKKNQINIDTSFIDFFGKFMWDPGFQQSRILYPIQQNGINIKTSKEWRHIPFYTQSEYIPTLTSDTLSIFDKELQLKPIKMFIIDFEKNMAESFEFERVNKNWYLKNCGKRPFANLPDRDFIDYLVKFSNDSIFQIKNISFPLSNSFADSGNDYRIATTTIKQNEWEFWELTKDINRLLLLSNLIEDNKYRNIFFRGVENGIWVKYTFEKLNGNWKLIKLEDYST